MARFTVRFDDELSDWIEEESERRERSKAWIIEQAAKAAKGEESVYSHRTDEDRTDAHRTDAHQKFASVERVAELEDRVAALEAEHSEIQSPEAEVGGTMDTEPSTDVTVDEELPASVEDVIGSWKPGRSAEEREERRDALREALEFLAAEGEATRSEFVEALYPETSLESQSSEDGWWRGMLLKGLKHAAEEGIIEKDGHTWRWVSERVEPE